MATFPIAILLIAGIFASTFGRVAQFEESARRFTAVLPSSLGNRRRFPSIAMRNPVPSSILRRTAPILTFPVGPIDDRWAGRSNDAGPSPSAAVTRGAETARCCQNAASAAAMQTGPTQNSEPPLRPKLNLSTAAPSVWNVKPDLLSENVSISRQLGDSLPGTKRRAVPRLAESLPDVARFAGWTASKSGIPRPMKPRAESLFR